MKEIKDKSEEKWLHYSHNEKWYKDNWKSIQLMEWIPTKERLPEKEGTYLVTRKGRIEIDSYHKNQTKRWTEYRDYIFTEYEEKGDVWVSGGSVMWDNPEAWMKLPEIYREKEDNEE